jgi:hypothetical protein
MTPPPPSRDRRHPSQYVEDHRERSQKHAVANAGEFAHARPLVREVFGRFDLAEVQTTIATASAGMGMRAGELIVSNTA